MSETESTRAAQVEALRVERDALLRRPEPPQHRVDQIDAELARFKPRPPRGAREKAVKPE